MQPSPENRYARQIQYAPIAACGQQLIENSRVTILGCGALGTVAAEILARSGVGLLRIVDRDVVEWTNLQRQALFDEQDAVEGIAKAEAASKHLARINHTIQIEPIVADVTTENIDSVLKNSDLIIDAADNFSIRFLLNDWSLKNRIPWVHGGCIGATGQVRLFTGSGAPCFRCLVPEPPQAASVQTCDTAGVIGAATHAIASLQAMEAIKWLSGNRDQVHQEIWSFDFWNNRFRPLAIDETLCWECRACRKGHYDFLDAQSNCASTAVAVCGRSAVQITPAAPTRVPLARLAEAWRSLGEVQQNRFFVRLKKAESSIQFTLFADGRAVVDGVEEPSQARALYDRLVGS